MAYKKINDDIVEFTKEVKQLFSKTALEKEKAALIEEIAKIENAKLKIDELLTHFK